MEGIIVIKSVMFGAIPYVSMITYYLIFNSEARWDSDLSDVIIGPLVYFAFQWMDKKDAKEKIKNT